VWRGEGKRLGGRHGREVEINGNLQFSERMIPGDKWKLRKFRKLREEEGGKQGGKGQNRS